MMNGDVPPAPPPPAEVADDLEAVLAGAMVLLDTVESLEPYLPDLTADDRERVDRYVGRASADATLRAYKSDWRLFCAWCRESGYRPLPATPSTVAAFLTLLAETGFVPLEPRRTKTGKVLPRKAPSPLGKATIGRRLAAIVFAHRAADLEPPTSQPDAARLEKAMRAIRREKRDDLPDKKRAADGDVMRDMLRSITGDDLRAYRDREPWQLGRLLITPHSAYHTPESFADIRRKSAETMAAALLSNAPQNVISPESD